jgi:hypothetical protein
MSDTYENMEAELTAIAKDISRFQQKAIKRQEAYANSQFADMPMWDRMVIEMVIENQARMTALEQRVTDLAEVFAPAPEFEQTEE